MNSGCCPDLMVWTIHGVQTFLPIPICIIPIFSNGVFPILIKVCIGVSSGIVLRAWWFDNPVCSVISPNQFFLSPIFIIVFYSHPFLGFLRRMAWALGLCFRPMVWDNLVMFGHSQFVIFLPNPYLFYSHPIAFFVFFLSKIIDFTIYYYIVGK